MAAAAVLTTWGTAAAALTPISGMAQVQATVFTAGGTLSNTSTRVVADWTGTPHNGSATASASLQGVDADLSAQGKTSASWSPDGSSGSVIFDWGWRLLSIEDAGLSGASFDGLNPNWSYTFRADRDGILTWEGYVLPSYDNGYNPFGLSGWNLQVNGVTAIDLFDPTGGQLRIGDQDFSLTAGETYTLSLVNSSNIAGYRFDQRYADVQGKFLWAIHETSVPEPTTWALLILGFGLTGVSLRRRTSAKSAI